MNCAKPDPSNFINTPGGEASLHSAMTDYLLCRIDSAKNVLLTLSMDLGSGNAPISVRQAMKELEIAKQQFQYERRQKLASMLPMTPEAVKEKELKETEQMIAAHLATELVDYVKSKRSLQVKDIVTHLSKLAAKLIEDGKSN